MKKRNAKNTPSNIARNLRKIRAEKRVSKSKLVSATGLDYHTIVKIESGKTLDPRVHTMVKIAVALKTTVEELVK